MVPEDWWTDWPRHVWVGTSVEDQTAADKRIPELLKIPAAVRFLSCEPLLSGLDLSRWLHPFEISRDAQGNDLGSASGGSDLSWLIAGGESGPNARPSHPGWFRSLRDQCQAAGVPFFFKQWGEWGPIGDDTPRCGTSAVVSPDGEYSLTVSGYEPGCAVDHAMSEAHMARVGKKAAGRVLDGREWSEFPEVRP